MPTCKNCNESFPNRMKIDGKFRNLSSRKYCLKCSPYGLNRTFPICKEANLCKIVICKICGREYVYSRLKGHCLDKCNSCSVNLRKKERKKKAVEYKGGKCICCGYDKSYEALSFHHIDPKIKDFGISGNHCISWERMKLELDKCILVCVLCHSEIENGIREREFPFSYKIGK